MKREKCCVMNLIQMVLKGFCNGNDTVSVTHTFNSSTSLYMIAIHNGVLRFF